HMLPGLLGPLLEQFLGGTYPTPALQGVFVGGDAIPDALVRQVRSILPRASLFLGYGPTEATIIATVFPVPDGQVVAGHTIGTPLANTQVRLYDRLGRLVPVGVVGELYLGGAGVTRGYLGQEELTAAKFVWLDGQRYYRTGDLARYRGDGVLEFVGRLDNQVKVRGYRIELGELETLLGQHEQLQESVVLVREDHQGHKRLVAYVVPVAGAKLTVTALREYLGALVPEYMLPSAFVMLERMPLTVNAKLDRKALPLPEQLRPDLGETFVAPSSPAEELLTQIWAEVLHLEQVGVHDNFFTLGGHSLLAIQLISRVREALRVEVSLQKLFDQPTVRAMAEEIEETLRGG
ncbi:MAG TPA: AMP-binding protein, partial [Gemmatimonadales bacterium]